MWQFRDQIFLDLSLISDFFAHSQDHSWDQYKSEEKIFLKGWGGVL